MTANGNEASYLAQEAQWARVTRTPTRLTTTDGSDDGRQDA